MKLVPNWREATKWWSVRLAALGAAIQAAYIAMPPAMAAALPEKWVRWNAAVMFLSILYSRVIDQRPADVTPDTLDTVQRPD